ncbi:dehydrogenase/reductase SDR family member 7-like [Phoenix dactylifera]|uniref:Dehydrogenase/reductase SDR family member 7-like n=1 Tax=Phoenix dactylifera TaxID=42345 RepID=A0A8B7CJX8_PHODC|nr:dehydrogenase/reductase SDR family member 7-like [Phoenix dactylifera]
MLILILVSLALAALLAFLVKFANADGDFTLLSKGPAKHEKIEGKVVWITGASRGIGEVLATQFASLGAKLILSARNAVELERVKARFAGKQVEILPLDLASGEESLREAVQKAESFFSAAGVDFMVHNAAYDHPPTTALAITEETLLTTFKTNVLGTISLTRLLAPYMLKRGHGHFIVMNSAAGKCPAPGQAAYSASKFALNGYFHTLSSELNQKGIKVTVVCPGPVDTSKESGAHASGHNDSEKPVPVERCAQLIIRAATHGLKEVWISNQPVLLVMYLVQYMPTLGYWFMDKIGSNRVDASASECNTSVMEMLFGQKKKTT